VSLILHVLPYDLARGAQRYARALVDSLAGDGDTHEILTLFRAEPVHLRPDVELDVPQGVMRRAGLDPRVVLRLRRELRDRRPSVVVAHGGESAKYTALSVPKGMPMVYLKIGTAHASLGRRANRGLHGLYTRRADVVAAVSRDVAEEAHILYDVPEEKITVLPNARDPEVFKPASDGEPAVPRLVFVGHLDQGKRPDWFLDVVGELRERGRRFEATMVGGGPLEATLRSRAESLGVEMLGVRDDVAAWLAGSDIFVFTSLPAGEGMPGVLIEAGLSGLATVTTRVPGARDVVEDGVTGLLVDIDDKGGLVEAVDRLIGDPGLRRSMGERARAHCVERFSLEASAHQWRELFDRLQQPALSPADQEG
jgi:glycosyltransferase involved in cell wall biosynthesis